MTQPARLLNFNSLTLRLANATRLRISPRRLEHVAGQDPVLVFDIL